MDALAVPIPHVDVQNNPKSNSSVCCFAINKIRQHLLSHITNLLTPLSFMQQKVSKYRRPRMCLGRWKIPPTYHIGFPGSQHLCTLQSGLKSYFNLFPLPSCIPHVSKVVAGTGEKEDPASCHYEQPVQGLFFDM